MVSRAEQIRKVEEFLDSEKPEGHTVTDVAKTIVDSIYDLLGSKLKETPTLGVGSIFKHEVTNKIHYVAWSDGYGLFWIVSSDSRYGYIGGVSPWVDYAGATRSSTEKYQTNDAGWKIGDKVSSFQRHNHSTVIAVAEKCVLLQRDGEDRPFGEPNDLLEKYYRKEVVEESIF